ncbi:MAG: RNA polymerase sigma-70 factor [Ignavibacteriaceae bacterium]|nr:RNA polymerase sigma-70 factor [Ignavibacteriaceae bacterium]
MDPNNNIFDISDKGLADSLKNDDQNSFKEIYKRFRPKLYIFAFNIINDRDVCEEIIQEIFIDLWVRRNEKEIENLSAYLYKAVKFQIYKQFRKKKLIDKHLAEFDEFTSSYNVEEHFEFKELFSRVESIIAKLPKQRRIIFQLSRDEGLSAKEIANKLNLSEQTVRNQIYSALKEIRASIKILLIFFF